MSQLAATVITAGLIAACTSPAPATPTPAPVRAADLRERVNGGVERDQPRADVAARFEVSAPTIERWLSRQHERGSANA